MTHPFTARMPERPPRQAHAAPSRSDNYGFLRGLDGDQCADVNLTWVWNDPEQHTEDAGGLAFGLHYADPDRNGYEHIMDGRHIRRMTHEELRHTDWPVDRVFDWRRGPTRDSERPRTQWELYRYVREHGGTAVGELKSRAFALHPWIMLELVDKAQDCDHAPWFKALDVMAGVEEKCANTRAAEGQFALIFGDRVKGRAARLREARRLTADWTVKPTRVW